jgi:hypothetical protein
LSKRCFIVGNLAFAKKGVRGRLQNAAARERMSETARRLLLPGALLVTIQAQLLAAFMFVDFRFATFFQ